MSSPPKAMKRKPDGFGALLIGIPLCVGLLLFAVLQSTFWPTVHDKFQNLAVESGYTGIMFFKQMQQDTSWQMRLSLQLVALNVLIVTLTCVIVRRHTQNHVRRRLGNLLEQFDRLQNDQSPSPHGSISEMISHLSRDVEAVTEEIKRNRGEVKQMLRMSEHRLNKRTEKFEKDMRQLERRSNSDSMTGLANRASLNTRFVEMFNEAQEKELDLACLMFDIDHFKEVNDTLGHDAGDRVIRFVSELLKASHRPQDLAARFGGDEFCLVLHNCSARQALNVGRRLNQLFARESYHFTTPARRRTDDPPVATPIPEVTAPSLSVGIATRKGNDPVNAEHLMKLADEALYEAKHAGKDCVRVR